MITDLLRNKLAAYIVELVDGTPLGITPSQYVSTLSTDNVIEIKLMVEGSNITGKVIREASFGADDSGDSFDNADAFMLSRVAFEGVGPFASNEQLEIFLMLEVE